METDMEVPTKLYKYRRFDDVTLESIIYDTLYFADPSTFNDPLDSRPSLELDVDEPYLTEILKRLVEQRTKDEMSAALKTGKVRGPRAADHVERQSRKQAEELLLKVEYYSTDPDGGDLKTLLGRQIEDELLRRYQNGIFCLAGRATCPLMWSHYGDQHRGICIGYSVPARTTVHKVKYGGTRLVDASNVAAMLEGSDVDRRQVEEAVLLRKAKAWAYEREWRLIGPHGSQHSTLELKEIIFGVKCGSAVKYALLKALEDRERPVQLFEMREVTGRFPLRKCALDCPEELLAFLPRRSLSDFEDFEEMRD